MKNKFLPILLIILFNFNFDIFSQEQNQSNNLENSSNTINSTENPSNEKKSKFNIDPFVIVGNHLFLNTYASQETLLSPIKFFIGGGAIFDFNSKLKISFQPNISIWNMYYAFDGKKAYATEIENRTATTLCLLFDFPVGIKFTKEKHSFTPGIGLGILARISFLSNGVNKNDSGATGSAENDLKEIQKWNFSNSRFLYPELFFAWDYQVSKNFSTGVVSKVFIPIASFIENSNFNETIFSVAARFAF